MLELQAQQPTFLLPPPARPSAQEMAQVMAQGAQGAPWESLPQKLAVLPRQA